jgi:hypothetical protein
MLHLMISLMSSAYQMNGSIDDAIHELHQWRNKMVIRHFCNK